MKKTALLCAALLVSASSAFAFTNNYAGYTLNNKTPDAIFQSANIYGYYNQGDIGVKAVSFFSQDNLSEMLEGKYTDAVFEETCAKLAVLTKADAQSAIWELPLLKPENLAKLNAAHKELLEKESFTQLKDKVKPEVTLGKMAGKKTIKISMFYKFKNEFASTQMTVLGANNNLYILTTADSQPMADKDEKPTVKPKEDEKKDSVKLEPIELDKVDPLLVKNTISNHQKFLKTFKVIPVSGKAEDAVVLVDNVSKKQLSLPLDWGYGQYNHKDKKNPGSFAIAVPSDVFSKIGLTLVNDKLDELELKDKEKTQEAVLDAVLSNTKHVVALGTYGLNKDKPVADALKEPMLAKLQLDALLGMAKKDSSRIPAKYLRINDLQHRTEFTSQYGKLELDVDTTLLEKYDFMCYGKCKANPDLAMASLYVRAKAEASDAAAEKMTEEWKF